MKLNLVRPLAFFDLETTGVNIASDRVVEVSILKVLPDQTEEVRTLRINPERPIPAESSFFHGIRDDDVRDAPTFRDVAADLADFIGDADLAGYNSNKFDIPMLMEEFLRAGVDFSLENRNFVDVQNIFHQMEQRTLKAAYRFYCNQELENAHSAEADVRATYEVLRAQLSRYEGVEWENKMGERSVPVVNDVPALHAFTNLTQPVDFAGRLVFNEAGVEVFNFGKHKGLPVEDVFAREPSYYAWMMNGDFPLYTKKCLEKIWNRFREKQKAHQQAGAVRETPQSRDQQELRDPSTPDQPSRSERTGRSVPPTSTKHSGRSGRPQKPSGPITDDMLQGLLSKFGKQ